jgi:hypothetical protein
MILLVIQDVSKKKPYFRYVVYESEQEKKLYTHMCPGKLIFACEDLWWEEEHHVWQYVADTSSIYCEMFACVLYEYESGNNNASSWDHWYWCLKCEIISCVLII